jgi:hypothetical protein
VDHPPRMKLALFVASVLILSACGVTGSKQHQEEILKLLPRGAWLAESLSEADNEATGIPLATREAMPTRAYDAGRSWTDTYKFPGGREWLTIGQLRFESAEAAGQLLDKEADYYKTSSIMGCKTYEMAPMGDRSQAWVCDSDIFTSKRIDVLRGPEIISVDTTLYTGVLYEGEGETMLEMVDLAQIAEIMLK